jgi:hypothetical protein
MDKNVMIAVLHRRMTAVSLRQSIEQVRIRVRHQQILIMIQRWQKGKQLMKALSREVYLRPYIDNGFLPSSIYLEGDEFLVELMDYVKREGQRLIPYADVLEQMERNYQESRVRARQPSLKQSASGEVALSTGNAPPVQPTSVSAVGKSSPPEVPTRPVGQPKERKVQMQRFVSNNTRDRGAGAAAFMQFAMSFQKNGGSSMR